MADERPTRRQLEFIEEIQAYVSEAFIGTTKRDASDYIGRNIELYKLLSMDSWCLERGYI